MISDLKELSTCKEVFFYDNGEDIVTAWLFYELNEIKFFRNCRFHSSMKVKEVER